ncbi:MAG TPA: NADPH-dependent F420 reductase [Ignavibacteriaceae bacterium]|jgi:NADPH-dependent F420 reductase|nr:NADPH-dependent F420 reductase [Ignavibacteriaceae bacterium]
MKIGIIGSGVVGQQLGIGLSKLGHEVKIGSRNPAKLSDWKKQAGEKSSAGTNAEAAKFGELIFLATGWEGTENALNLAGKENFTEKIVVDVTNPLAHSKGGPPGLDAAPGNSGGEKIQSWLPDSKVVKAFNTVNAYIMAVPHREEGDPDLFICGNDEGAKSQVAGFAEQWGWKSIIDMGNITEAYWLEALTMLWIHYGFKNNVWSHAFKLLKK